MPQKIKINNTWKNTTAGKIKINNTWKNVVTGYRKDAGNWRPILSSKLPGNYGALVLNSNNDRRLLTESPAANAIVMHPDGNSFYTLNADYNALSTKVYRHYLSSKHNVASITSTVVSAELYTDLDGGWPMSIDISGDGTKLYLLVLGSNILTYQLSQPYDISSMTLLSVTAFAPPITGGGTVTYASHFSFFNSGNHIVCSDLYNNVSIHSLSTPYNPLSANSGTQVDLPTQYSSAGGQVTVSNDGTQALYINYTRTDGSFSSASLKVLYLHTPYDLSNHTQTQNIDITSDIALPSISEIDILTSHDYKLIFVLMGEGLSSTTNTHTVSFGL